MDLSPVAHALVSAAALAVTTLAGLAIPLLPRAFVALRVWVNGADAELLRHALANAATNAVPAVRGGQPMHRAVDEIVAYVEANLPRALARLKVPPETLHLMAQAALARALA
jgi:hypothetical protein